MFEIGDRIKCIDAKWHNKIDPFQQFIDKVYDIGECPLELGRVYTVRGWYISPYSDVPACVCLEEVPNYANRELFNEPDDTGFDPLRFRKILDIKDGMKQIMSLFNRPKVDVPIAAPKPKILEPAE